MSSSSNEVILEQGGLQTLYDWCPCKQRTGDQTQTQGRQELKLEAGTGVMHLQAQEAIGGQPPPEAGREARSRPSLPPAGINHDVPGSETSGL